MKAGAMKTRTTPIEQLKPGDKIFVPRHKNTPSYFPEILTVKRINLKDSIIDIEENGGFGPKAKHFELVLDQNPKKKAEPEKNEQLSFLDRL